MATAGKDLNVALRITADVADGQAKLREIERALNGVGDAGRGPASAGIKSVGAAAKSSTASMQALASASNSSKQAAQQSAQAYARAAAATTAATAATDRSTQATTRARDAYGRFTASASQATAAQNAAAAVSQKVGLQMDVQAKAVNRLKGVVAAYVSMRTLQYLAGLSDAYGQNASRIRNATDSTEEYEMVQARLLATANGTYRALGEAQEVFLSTSRTLKELGYSTEQVLDISDSLSYAFTRDAARADQATNAMDAYSKSLAKGRIDADAWASIIAASDSIIGNVAKATGRTTLEIQRLGAEGKLSLEALNEGLRQSLAENKAAADAMEVSTRDASVAMRNALTVFVGKVNEASGASNVFTENLGAFSALLQDPATVNAAVDMANGIVTALNTIISCMRTAVEVAKWFGEELAARMHGAASDDVVRLEQEAERWEEMARNPLLRVRVGAMKNGERQWVTYFSEEEALAQAKKTRERLQNAIKERDKLAENAKNPTPSPTNAQVIPPRIVAAEAPTKPAKPKSAGNKQLKEAAKLQEQQAQEAARYLSALQQQLDEVGKMSALERVNYDVQKGKVKLSAEQLDLAQQLAGQVDARAQQEKAAEAALNVQNATLAAQRQLLIEIAGYNAEIAAASMGDKAAADMQQRLTIEQQFAQRTQQIEDQRRQALAKATEQDKARINSMYDDVLAIEKAFQAQSLQAYDQHVAARKMADADWSNGAKKAMANWLEDLDSKASQAQDIFSTAIAGFGQGFNDALWAGNWDTLADLGRDIAMKIINGMVDQNLTRPLVQWMQSSVGSGGGLFSQVFSSIFPSTADAGKSTGGLGGALNGLVGGGGGIDAAASTAAYTANAGAVATATGALTGFIGALTTATAALGASSGTSAVAGAASNAGGWFSAIKGAFGFATGGPIRGPGTGTSDSIPILASNGEFMVRAAAASSAAARAFLHDFNSRGMAALKHWSQYATGGLITDTGSRASGIPSAAAFQPTTPVTNTSVDNRLALNLIDDPDRIASVLTSRRGEEAFTVLLSRNPAKFRQLLNIS